jgi:hypothetical protein
MSFFPGSAAINVWDLLALFECNAAQQKLILVLDGMAPSGPALY